MAKSKKPCVTCGVREKYPGKHRCAWCWIAAQPIETQVAAARRRLIRAEQRPDYTYRGRVSKDQWPDGYRWCSGCQSFVPLEYVSGSRCKACDSKAKHDSHVQRIFGIPAELYHRLLAWQGGKCYICGRVPRSRRLAVDHDHNCCPGDTSCGECVRGLLCADDDWGCNHRVLGIITHIEMAQRIVDYYEIWPLKRMLRGDPPPKITHRPVPAIHDLAADPPPY